MKNEVWDELDDDADHIENVRKEDEMIKEFCRISNEA